MSIADSMIHKVSMWEGNRLGNRMIRKGMLLRLVGVGILGAAMVTVLGGCPKNEDCQRSGRERFAPEVAVTVGDSSRRFLLSVDLDADSDIDLVVANGFEGNLAVLLNEGDGSFSEPVFHELPQFPVRVTAALLDGDDLLDLAVISSAPAWFDESTHLSILMGVGDGRFADPVTQDVLQGSTSVVAGDFTEDGATDLIVADGFLNVVLLTNQGDGSFPTESPLSTGVSIPIERQTLGTGDFDDDGHLDFALAGRIFFGHVDGTFATPTGGTSTDPVVIVDMDGDGDLDMVFGDPVISDGYGPFHGQIRVLLNRGDGTFEEPRIVETSEDAPMPLAVGDLDLDGHLDIVAAIGGSELTLLLLYGAGDGSFEEFAFCRDTTPPMDYGRFDDIELADLNGDGLLDIVAANSGEKGLSIFFGEPQR